MRGVNTRRSKKSVQAKKTEGFQRKFLLLVVLITLVLVALVYYVYSSF